jgi:cobalt-precorrin-5B (C1)-methyltransferase
VEAGLAGLAARDPAAADRLRQRIATSVEQRAEAYLARYGQQATRVGAVLFDRQRRITARAPREPSIGRPFRPEA